jgi:tetratricopeptide (TPR) repeat protein
MNRGNPTLAMRRLRLVPGKGEAEQLDHFLMGTDSLLIASLQKEEQGLRRRKRVWSLAVLLGLATVMSSLWLSGLLRPADRVSLDLEKARLLVDEGRDLMSKEQYDEAVPHFLRAVKLAPGLADAWAELGNCQLHNYQSGLAERAFRQALALEPDNVRALDGLGGLHLRRGEEREAEEAWLRGGLDRQLARLYLLQGRFREAEVHLVPLLGELPKDELLDRMARAAMSQHVDSGLRSLLEPEPAGMSPWADLGWRRFKENRYSEAAAAFGKAIAEIPYDVNALSGMGSSLLALNRAPEAKFYFERALRLDDDHALSLNGLAQCLKSEGRIAEAIAVWQGMSQLYPGVNYGTPGLAWTYYELRDYRQAALYFAKMVKRYPYDSRLLNALNVAVENIGAAGS